MWGYGKMMKRVILNLVVFLVMLSTVFALTTYTGAPQLPYLLYGNVVSNGDPVPNAKLTITNENTGYSFSITTGVNGYWQEETGNWLTSAGGRSPVQFDDVVKVTVSTSCGTNDVCTKSFKVFNTGFESPAARINFALTGIIIAPPAPSGGSGGGGGSSGGSGGGGSGVRWTCEGWGACSQAEEQIRKCTDSSDNIRTETRTCDYTAPAQDDEVVVVVDEPIVDEPIIDVPIVDDPIVEPPVVPEDEEDLFLRLVTLVGIVLGALGVQWYRGILGIVRYHWKKGNKAQAIKTLFTLIKRAEEGAYNKK